MPGGDRSLYRIQTKGVLSNSGMTVTITNVLNADGTESTTPAAFSGASIVFSNDRGTKQEMAIGTASGGTLTLSNRGLDQSDTITNVPAFQLQRGAGTVIYVTKLAFNFALDFAQTAANNNFIGNNTFSGTNTFSGPTIFTGATNAFTNLSVTTKFGGPGFANTTARDAAIPSPVNGMVATVAGDLQHYNGVTVQWETAATGTPTPNASTSVAGKTQQATTTDIGSSTVLGSTGAPLFINPGTTKKVYAGSGGANYIPVIADDGTLDQFVNGFGDQTYYLGNNVTAGQPLFVETTPVFAAATSVQPVSNINGKNRASITVIGAGVSSAVANLGLRKYGTPTQPLTVRIETDSAGFPSGTLANVNATVTVAQAGLTTSLVDTAITFPGAFTLTAGIMYHIVLCQGTYGTETIDSVNYYGFGYSTNNTTTRVMNYYNGTSWVIYDVSVTDNNGASLTSTASSQTLKTGFVIFSKFNQLLTQVNAHTGSGFTKLYVYLGNDVTSTLLTTADFVGDTAYLSQSLSASTYYTILADHPTGTYTLYYAAGASYPVSGTNVNITTGNGGDTGNYKAFDSIVTTSTTLLSTFAYASSTLFSQSVLSLANATYSYKSDVYGYSTVTASIGSSKPTIVLPNTGIEIHQTGLTIGTAYYLGNTDGTISSSVGTTHVLLGTAVATTALLLNRRNLYSFSITPGGSPYTYQNLTGKNIQVLISSGTVSNISISKDNSVFDQLYSATGHFATLYPLDYLKVTYSVTPTLTGYYLQ